MLSRKSVERGVSLGKGRHLPESNPISAEEGSSPSSVLNRNVSHFAGAHDFVIYGGTYNNINGNYMVLGEAKDPGWCLQY